MHKIYSNIRRYNYLVTQGMIIMWLFYLTFKEMKMF